jgi:hypothetical protein|tara:strand:- start:99 stop:335 length:237 start_codon:yes stop_codon:yes gene_type:complete
MIYYVFSVGKRIVQHARIGRIAMIKINQQETTHVQAVEKKDITSISTITYVIRVGIPTDVSNMYVIMQPTPLYSIGLK